MQPGYAALFTVTIALIGIVILVASLLSGLIERSGVPQVGIFLLLGLLLGPNGLGLLDFPLHSPTLAVIATLALMLVLFSDALSVNVGDVRRERALTLLVLGPGTLVTAALTAFAAWALLGFSPAGSAVLGAALASTDPVILRTLLRQPDLPRSARLALRLESGMNDVVLLPIVVLVMRFVTVNGGNISHVTPSDISRDIVGLFLLGPGLGALIGWIAITALDRIRSRIGVRRDYESIYALGVALSAFAAADAVGGSGFLAAFAAGLIIAAMDVELCDCFLDYGDATAEMFLLLTFVALGTSSIWLGLTVVSWRTLAFVAIALIARTVVLVPILHLPILREARVDANSRTLIAWFGPRGLSTLLLALLPVFAGIPGSEHLFAIASLVVLFSIVLHGSGIALYVRRASKTAEQLSPAAPPEPVPERITLDELRALWRTNEQVVVLDVRTERAFERDARRARGAIRVAPDDAVRTLQRLDVPKDATVVAFCT
jgi:NhaP-type Na+/H+ or K+/H+ antiporter